MLASADSPDELVGGGGCEGATLYAGEALAAGGYLCSSSGGYELIMQGDGNLVEYNSSGQAMSASDTYEQSGNYAVIQSDGNLVVYSSSGQMGQRYLRDRWRNVAFHHTRRLERRHLRLLRCSLGRTLVFTPDLCPRDYVSLWLEIFAMVLAQ